MTCSQCNAIGHKEREKESERYIIDVVRGRQGPFDPVELTKEYGMLAMSTYDYLGLGLMTAAIYFALSYPASILANRLERKLRYDRR